MAVPSTMVRSAALKGRHCHHHTCINIESASTAAPDSHHHHHPQCPGHQQEKETARIQKKKTSSLALFHELLPLDPEVALLEEDV